MIRLLLAAALLAAPASAQEVSREVHQNCVPIGELAADVMKSRQRGVDFAQVMQTSYQFNGGFRALYQEIIRAAYEKPRFNTSRYRQDAVNDFRNLWYRACIDRSLHR